MKLQKALFWVLVALIIGSLILFSVNYAVMKIDILNDIAIALLTSGFTGALTACISFYFAKDSVKRSIEQSMQNKQRLLISLRNQLAFMRKYNKEYSLDFPLDNVDIDTVIDDDRYKLLEAQHNYSELRFKKLFDTLCEIDDGIPLLSRYGEVANYTGLCGVAKKFNKLIAKLEEKYDQFKFSTFENGNYCRMQYANSLMDAHTAFEVYVKNFLNSIANIDMKVDETHNILVAIDTLLHPRMYYKCYKSSNKAKHYCENLKGVFDENKIKIPLKIRILLKTLAVTNRNKAKGI